MSKRILPFPSTQITAQQEPDNGQTQSTLIINLIKTGAALWSHADTLVHPGIDDRLIQKYKPAVPVFETGHVRKK